MNFYILDYKTYIKIKSSQVFKMIRGARLKKDMNYNQNYSKENFSDISFKLEWISLFYT